MAALDEQYWIEIRGGRRLLGLTPDFAESLPGDWIALDLAPPGDLIEAGDSFGLLTTESASHDLRAPQAFRIVAVNPRAVADAQIVRLSPAGQGWLLEIADPE